MRPTPPCAVRSQRYSHRIKGLALALVALLLVGCSSTSGREQAQAACAVEAPAASPGFDPERESLAMLIEAASAAEQAADLADEAANLDERWSLLADASRAVAIFADVLVAARMEGTSIDEATTPEMWDQAKLATAAFAAECRRIGP